MCTFAMLEKGLNPISVDDASWYRCQHELVIPHQVQFICIHIIGHSWARLFVPWNDLCRPASAVGYWKEFCPVRDRRRTFVDSSLHNIAAWAANKFSSAAGMALGRVAAAVGLMMHKSPLSLLSFLLASSIDHRNYMRRSETRTEDRRRERHRSRVRARNTETERQTDRDKEPA